MVSRGYNDCEFLEKNNKNFSVNRFFSWLTSCRTKEASVGTVTLTTQTMVTEILHSQLITSQIDTANLANYILIEIFVKPKNVGTAKFRYTSGTTFHR
jgi:hypothetical protein